MCERWFGPDEHLNPADHSLAKHGWEWNEFFTVALLSPEFSTNFCGAVEGRRLLRSSSAHHDEIVCCLMIPIYLRASATASR